MRHHYQMLASACAHEATLQRMDQARIPESPGGARRREQAGGGRRLFGAQRRGTLSVAHQGRPRPLRQRGQRPARRPGWHPGLFGRVAPRTDT
eukprot:scaffold79_cov259-Pinguiococcus_pyrenoidosus.AAC.17